MLLSDIVSDICTRAGLTTADIDVSALSTYDVLGFTIPRQMQARTALETLMAAYSFDACEEDWKLIFKKRGSSSILSISSAEMRAYPYGDSVPDRAVETRTQNLELPTHLTLSYESKVRDYQIATQHAVRIDKNNILRRETQLGIVLDDSFAKKQVEIILKRLWTNRHRYAFSTNYKYLKLSPGDVITVNGKQMRVTEMLDGDGVVSFVCESEKGGTYDTDADSDDLTINAIDLTGSTYVPSLLMMNMPTYDSDIGSAGLWYAIYGRSTHSGGSVERSYDGAVYSEVSYFNRFANAIVGRCGNDLSSGISGIVDFSTSLTIKCATSYPIGSTLQKGEIKSVGSSALWENANLAAIGCSSAGWEIIQFQTATTTATAYEYSITGFLRGLYGTDDKRGVHTTNDRLVLLTDTAGNSSDMGVDFIAEDLDDVGRRPYYRTKNSDDVTRTAARYRVGQKSLDPYPPQIAFGSRNSSNDIDLNWYRGDRYEFEQDDMPDGVDVAMNEESLEFRVNVINTVTSAVVRSIDTTNSSWTYTAAMQSSDSYPVTHPITFDIYQLSTVTSTSGLALRVSI